MADFDDETPLTTADEPAPWRARFYRYHSVITEEYDTLTEAIARLACGMDDGTLAADAIIAPDGTELTDANGLKEALWSVQKSSTYADLRVWIAQNRPEWNGQ